MKVILRDKFVDGKEMERNTVISKRLLACSSLLGRLDQKGETENDTVISNFLTYSHNCTEIVLLELSVLQAAVFQLHE